MDGGTLITILDAVWWLLFFTALGLCLGSFLNAVIYRVPRGISLRDPLWSFCPGCKSPLHWYDNLPVISYLRLRGRCRVCGMPIAERYPVVEMTMAVVLLLLLDAFFIAHQHPAVAPGYKGITWQLQDNWPIFLAHIVLFAGLLAMSAIDIEVYWVDVRFTTVATLTGFVMHALWQPAYGAKWPGSSDRLGAVSIAVTAAFLVTLLILRLLWPRQDEPEATTEPSPDLAREEPTQALGQSVGSELLVPDGIAAVTEGTPPLEIEPDEGGGSMPELQQETTGGEIPQTGASEPATVEVAEPPMTREAARWPGHLLIAVTAAVLLTILITSAIRAIDETVPVPYWVSWAPGILLLLGLIIGVGGHARESDKQIVQSIEQERVTARRVAVLELLCLAPAIAAGVLVLAYLQSRPGAASHSADWLSWGSYGQWHPIAGLGRAASGFVIGGGIGWGIRIIATLIMGKEAFGTGDIHMMAAAGCVAGWPVVLIGFLLCSVLALVGWVLTLPFKQPRAIPLGPWLSIAFLIVVIGYASILHSQTVQNVVHLFGAAAVSSENLTSVP